MEVDKTLMASDTDNDNCYWTRYPDGLDTNSDTDWQFRERVLSKEVVRSGKVNHTILP